MGIPSERGISVVIAKPKAWKVGKVDIITSLSTAPNSMAACLAFAAILLCDSSTPFGDPSLPLENKMAAVSFIETFLK